MKIRVCVCIVVFFLGGCASKNETGAIFTSADTGKQFARVKGTSLTEVKYGNKVYLKIAAAKVISHDEKLNKYIRLIRDSLVPYAERDTLPYLISIIDDERIYAVSTPGGYIYVSVGMLDFVTTESELAAVLAHEIAQTQYKAQYFRVSKRFMQFLKSVSQFAKYVVPYGFGIPQGLKVFDNLAMSDISPKEAVIRADTKAMTYLKKSGYRPEALGEIVEKCLDYDASIYNTLQMYLVNRPITDERIANIKACMAPLAIDRERAQREEASYAKVRKYVKQYMQHYDLNA